MGRCPTYGLYFKGWNVLRTLYYGRYHGKIGHCKQCIPRLATVSEDVVSDQGLYCL